MPDSFFCTWCSVFVPSPSKGKKANFFARWVALAIDPLIAIVLYFVAIGIFGSLSEDLGTVVAILFPLGYFIWFLFLLRKGLTPGKKLLGLKVINHQTGEIPGFGKMFLREIIGRFLSGLFLGLGYFWALFDKNAQAWHDKLAGTVVVKGS
jgi:uncharacterized RDD family membrane protein YckC